MRRFQQDWQFFFHGRSESKFNTGMEQGEVTTDEATKKAKDTFQKTWGPVLALGSAAIYYGLCAWQSAVPEEATLTLVMTGAAGIAKWITDRNKVDTSKAVQENLNWEKLLAAIGVRESFEQLEEKQAERHQQNKQAHDDLMKLFAEKEQADQAAHDEHRRTFQEHRELIDELKDGQTALGKQMGDVTKELKVLGGKIDGRDGKGAA